MASVEIWRDAVLTVVCAQCNSEMDLAAESVHANAHRRELDGELVARCPDCASDCPMPTPTGRAGYFWWSCLPGCLPDSEPQGPFETFREAQAAANADGE